MTIPIPVLDDRSFEQLVAEARARVAVHTPELTNLGEADPASTIIDVFAFLVDNLLYRSNRIPEANRRKFLTMLGISLMPPSPGRGLVTIGNDKGPLTPPLEVAAGTLLRAGRVPFSTLAPLDVLPLTSVAYVKVPVAVPEEQLRRYQDLYASFLQTPADALSFYTPVALEPPATGRPDTVVDLGDQQHGTIDRALWLALLAPKGADVDAVRRAVAGQSLSIGVYPAAGVAGRLVAAETVATGSGSGHPDGASAGAGTADAAGAAEPGLIVQIAAPEPDASGASGPGYGIGPARYATLPVSWADPVLVGPGLIQVTLPPYERILRWAFDPEEEGTGDYPPRLDDPVTSSRLLTWLRLRYPEPVAAGASPRAWPGAPDEATSAGRAPAARLGTHDDPPPRPGCECDCDDLATGRDPAGAAPGEAERLTGQLSWVGVNATRVVQAVAVAREALGLGDGTPYQEFSVAQTPIVADEFCPGGGLRVEVRNADGTWTSWREIDDIHAAAAGWQVFTCDRATGRIASGSGLNGARFPLGMPVRASYSYGGSSTGRVAVDAITSAPTLPGGYTVTNPVPTWGAGDGESVLDGERAITRWLRHRDRLVTADDFRDLTRRTPGVDLGRVEVLPSFHPGHAGQAWPGAVTVLVVPRSDPRRPTAPAPDRQVLDAVCRWLVPRRLVTTELHVRGPVYRRLLVSVGVQTLPGHVPAQVNRAVTAAVGAFLSPLTGGLPTDLDPDGLIPGPGTPARAPTGTGWPLGVPVRAQDVEAVATRVPGVRYVVGVLLGVADRSGTLVSPAARMDLEGLELPEPTVFVTAGPPPDPADLAGDAQAVPVTMVPVPIVPPSC